jgi:hypothetical protein
MRPLNEKETCLPIRCNLTLLYMFSLVIAILTAIASMIGIIFPNIVYPTEVLFEAFASNDIVNLLIGLPILLVSMWLARQGRTLGILLWPGALIFTFYNSMVYTLVVPMNAVFILHMITVVLSACTFITLLANIDGGKVREQLAGSVHERLAGGILVGFGVLFLIMVISSIATALIQKTPIPGTEFALHISDLILSPVLIIGGVALWKRNELGYALGLGLLFQISMLFIGLIAVFMLQPFITHTPIPVTDTVVILVMGLIAFIPLALFIRGVERTRKQSPKKTI